MKLDVQGRFGYAHSVSLDSTDGKYRLVQMRNISLRGHRFYELLERHWRSCDVTGEGQRGIVSFTVIGCYAVCPPDDGRVSFLKMILEGKLDAALVFADWLEERGDTRDARRVRLRLKRMERELAPYPLEALNQNVEGRGKRWNRRRQGRLRMWREHYQESFQQYMAREFLSKPFHKTLAEMNHDPI